MRVILVNTSTWPDPILRVLIKWIAKELGIKDFYKVVIRNSNRSGWSGTCYSCCECVIRFGNFKNTEWPFISTYGLYKDAPKYPRYNRLEILVHALAHEMYHSTYRLERIFNKKMIRPKKRTCEIMTDEKADQVVRRFRVEFGNGLKTKMRKAMTNKRKRLQKSCQLATN